MWWNKVRAESSIRQRACSRDLTGNASIDNIWCPVTRALNNSPIKLPSDYGFTKYELNDLSLK